MNQHVLIFLVAAISAQLLTMILAMLFTNGLRDMNGVGEGWLEVATFGGIAVLGWKELAKTLS